ncbi:MAG: DUF3137 domain-containing protein [Pseudomonadota bacterium]
MVAMGEVAMISEFSFTEQTEVERGFKPVFQKKIVPILKKREIEHIRRRRNLFVGAGGVAAFGVLAGLLVVFSAGIAKGVAVGIVCLMVASMIAAYQQMKWRKGLGTEILPIMAEFLGDMIYGREEIALCEFEDRGVVPQFSKSEIEDAMAGSHKGLKWAMAEATLATKRGTRSGQRTVFKGLLMKIEIFGPSPRILMVPRGHAAGEWLGELFSSTRKKTERFETGIERFDAEVACYSKETDQARSFIDDHFAAGLLELGRSVSSRPVAAAMEGQWLYLAIPHSRNLLSFGSLWTPVQEIEADLHKVFEELTLPRRIIDLLSGR